MLSLRRIASISPRLASHGIARQAQCYTHSRAPNYGGWWTIMLEQQAHASCQQQETHPHELRKPLAIPTESLTPEQPPQPPAAKDVVMLNGRAIELPEKPPPPDNCCMSGCAICVWDLYEEEMEEYQAKKQEIRQMLDRAGQALPASLAPSNKSAVEEMEDEMDPTIKAFRAMERKLNKG